MKLIYVSHPVSGNIQENLKDLLRIIKIIHTLRNDVYAVAPYYTDALIGGDNDEILERCKAIITTGTFDEIWLTGNSMTDGMKFEADLFKLMNYPVVNMVGKL